LLPGPLHRLTKLKDDPAARWLSSSGRTMVMLKGWGVWVAYWISLRVLWRVLEWLIETFLHVSGRVMFISLPGLITAMVGAALLLPIRYFVVVLRSRSIAARAKAEATALATAVDDLKTLDAEPDGRVVSLVGWVRGHAYLMHRAGGHQAAGLALHCRGQQMVETLHNFDVVDEAGDTALVVAAGARLLGAPNVQLSRASADDRALVSSLDLPAGVVPTYWNAFVVRDGDPVMVIGTKTTVQDLSELQHGRPAARTAVGSTSEVPLLVFPLAAERRDV
jgi:hypothetical protein